MIKILDCTLRDGGYINNWEFGFDNIKQIINSLSKSNIDYIECGFLKNIDYKNTCNYVTISTYNRFLIPMLKLNTDKAIYLDVDVIVIGDILKFYEQDLNNHIIGAIPDLCRNKEYLNNIKECLGLKSDSKYFNAGVLLINCQKWRENSVTNKLFDIEVKYRKNTRKGYPQEAVGRRKQIQISRIAMFYFSFYHIPMEHPSRFDVISICGDEIVWIRDAFTFIGG